MLLFPFLSCYAQQKPDYSTVEGTKAQKIARANEVARQAAQYLLATPPDTSDQDIKEAGSYLMMWMTETEEYTFELDVASVKLYDENLSLLPRLMAGMVLYQMNHHEEKDNRIKVRAGAARTLIAYVKTPAYNISVPDALRKADEADKKGKLEQYLNALEQD